MDYGKADDELYDIISKAIIDTFFKYKEDPKLAVAMSLAVLGSNVCRIIALVPDLDEQKKLRDAFINLVIDKELIVSVIEKFHKSRH